MAESCKIDIIETNLNRVGYIALYRTPWKIKTAINLNEKTIGEYTIKRWNNATVQITKRLI